MHTAIRTINAAGLNEIAAFLGARHKRAQMVSSGPALHAWAADAESQMAEGNTPSIEIKSHDSVSGHTEEFTVSASGIDTQYVEIDD